MKTVICLIIIVVVAIVGYNYLGSTADEKGEDSKMVNNYFETNIISDKESTFPANPNKDVDYSQSQLKEIWLAGGCFWGVEAYMTRVYGVADAVSGYANGNTENPTYEEVCSEFTGHTETVRVVYDPERVELTELLEKYFKIIDPTSQNRQGYDIGSNYRSGVYYKDNADLPVIRAVVEEVQKKYDRPVVTEILPLANFYEAEEYHQDYLEKNPNGYCHIDFSNLEEDVLVDPTLYSNPDDATL